MEQAKKRIRICLICVVAAAVLLGIFYFAVTQSHDVSEDNGTLVMIEKREGDQDAGQDLIC